MKWRTATRVKGGAFLPARQDIVFSLSVKKSKQALFFSPLIRIFAD